MFIPSALDPYVDKKVLSIFKWQNVNKGNNKITEHRAIFQRERQKHKSTNRQNQSTTGKLGKPQWPWLGTGISKEMVGWIRFYDAKPPASITV